MQRFFSECGVEGVEVDQCVRGDSVEGQSASRMIHIDSDSTRDKSGGGKDIGGGDEGGGGGGGGGDIHISLLVPEKVTAIRAKETPGLIIKSKQTLIPLASPSVLCNSLIYQHLLSTRAPSNSDQSDHLYTAVEDRHQICLDDQDMTEPPPHVSPSCCCQTVSVLCSLCLCRL